MPITYPGRIEGRIKIPTGGTSVSASTGALTSPVTVTVPAGNYYLTAAGGVSSLLTTLEDELNENVRPYPDNAAALTAAIGYGNFTSGAGWLMQEASGSLAAAFGSPSLTAVSSPTYQNAGPATGKYAVGFDSAADAFSGGNNFNPGASDDLIIAWVGRFSSSTGTREIFSKWGGVTPRYIVFRNGSALTFNVNDGVDNVDVGCGIGVGEWHAGIAVVERATNRARIGIRTLAGVADVGSEGDISAVGTLTNAQNFSVGSNGGYDADSGFSLAALYIATGSGVATGLSANLSAALTSFANAINASWSCSLSTTDGRITVQNSFWPSYVQFTSTNLRSLIGFESDFDYPQTAAQLTAALGGYGDFTSGAGYLCNEASGNLASVFGTPATLTASGTPTYENQGARGGADKAVGTDSAADYFDGGDVWNVGSADDLVVIWVGRFSASGPAAYETMFSRTAAAMANGWAVVADWIIPRLSLHTSTSGATVAAVNGIGAFHIGQQHVGIAVIDRSTGNIRIGTQGLTTGTQTVSSTTSLGGTAIQVAGTFRFGQDAWTATAATTFQCSAFYVGHGSGVATGLSASLSTALSSFAAYMKSQTGTQHARGLWLPDSPLNCAQHPSMAPEETDVRYSESPTGYVLGLSGSRKYVHEDVRWMRVPVERIREASATYDNASFEQFFRDCISGLGAHAYLGPATPMQIYWNNAGSEARLGEDENIAGWRLVGVSKFKDAVTVSQPGWTGQWDVRFGRLVSDG